MLLLFNDLSPVVTRLRFARDLRRFTNVLWFIDWLIDWLVTTNHGLSPQTPGKLAVCWSRFLQPNAQWVNLSLGGAAVTTLDPLPSPCCCANTWNRDGMSAGTDYAHAHAHAPAVAIDTTTTHAAGCLLTGQRRNIPAATPHKTHSAC